MVLLTLDINVALKIKVNKTDSNTTKDVFGTILINPLKTPIFGISLYKGKHELELIKYTRNRSSIGVKYEDGKLLVRSEYVIGLTNAINSDGF